MLKKKVSELSIGAHVDNVLNFQPKETEYIIEIKNILNLKQCGVTKSCITTDKGNSYNCACYNKCEALKGVLRLFI